MSRHRGRSRAALHAVTLRGGFGRACDDETQEHVSRRADRCRAGAFDGLSARLVEQAGFPAIYASGGAMARSDRHPRHRPDHAGDEVVARLAGMVEVVDVPVIADARHRLRQRPQRPTRGARVRARRGGCLAPRGSGLSEEMRSLRRQGARPDRRRWCRSSRRCATPCTIRLLRDRAHRRDRGRGVRGGDRARPAPMLEAGADMIFVEAPTSEEQIVDIARGCPGSSSSTCSTAARRRCCRSRVWRSWATTSSSSPATPSAPPSRRCSACWRRSPATAAPGR